MAVSKTIQSARRPDPAALIELLKPITWFPPVWAFACGIVSAGGPAGSQLLVVAAGLILAGPMVCGMSQAVNDWYDRHVDAINEPRRPIPSGRVPGRWGLWIAWLWTALSLLLAWAIGPWAFGAALLAVAFAWAYSAPPLRLKRNGWWGNAAVAICYEGVPWFTGAAIVLGAAPGWPIVAAALLYSAGCHGIMTLNDFKSIEGDRRMGLGSLPVRLGPDRAARLACWVMALPQLVVIGLLLLWASPWHAAVVTALLAAQLVLMRRMLADPKGRAVWYSATGVGLYVLGMMITALAIGAAP